MIKSMTGYGRAFKETSKRNFTIEIKSVNSRYLDLSIKIPRNLISLEDKIRKAIQKKINRGKVDLYLTQVILKPDNTNIILNKDLSDNYFNCLNEIKERYSLKDNVSLSLIAKFPDIITVEQGEEDLEEIWENIKVTLDKAIDVLVEMRKKEGLKLKEDIIVKCNNLTNFILEIEKNSEDIINKYKQKLNERITQLLSDFNIDENRIAMEAAILCDKACVDEEIVRLKSHIAQLEDSLNLNEPVGRKLDFIVQEMNREANTIASKSNDVHIVNVVLNIKNEIEKIREQVQNIE